MANKIQRELRLLKIYAFLLTAVVAGMLIMSFAKQKPRETFTEIDVERINIVEADGTIKMVISNKKRQHPGMMSGKLMPTREREAGMIFFNDEGDECGGFIFDGNPEGNGMAISFDQYKNDQVMQLINNESANGNKRTRSYGLKMWDRSDEFGLEKFITFLDSMKRLNDQARMDAELKKLQEKGYLGPERLFVGKNKNEDYGLFINDDKGKPRIRIYLSKDNKPTLEFLDASGKPIPIR